jgi:hypothetical protein
MEIITEGSKAETHAWQNKKILEYFAEYGIKPILNKSFW